jgi:hypothetical protein
MEIEINAKMIIKIFFLNSYVDEVIRIDGRSER